MIMRHGQIFQINYWLAYLRFERQQDDSVLHVSHEAKYEVFYEPFYVSLDTTPPHDERFLGYGFTRNSQVRNVELAMTQYYFKID